MRTERVKGRLIVLSLFHNEKFTHSKERDFIFRFALYFLELKLSSCAGKSTEGKALHSAIAAAVLGQTPPGSFLNIELEVPH